MVQSYGVEKQTGLEPNVDTRADVSARCGNWR